MMILTMWACMARLLSCLKNDPTVGSQILSKFYNFRVIFWIVKFLEFQNMIGSNFHVILFVGKDTNPVVSKAYFSHEVRHMSLLPEVMTQRVNCLSKLACGVKLIMPFFWPKQANFLYALWKYFWRNNPYQHRHIFIDIDFDFHL